MIMNLKLVYTKLKLINVMLFSNH